eukprot:CAMPEP_0114237062 /NCGR_PEP_ID=MMETSP0058-20121206/7185_1 /TAXON_ID=36894 /ORGANISM="Pyramimonas parkeae, CCMP726" /LENGTH=37 /DNA_ID= /DNA_START= /DNA_END= /DNA_ORIENTATION=
MSVIVVLGLLFFSKAVGNDNNAKVEDICVDADTPPAE